VNKSAFLLAGHIPSGINCIAQFLNTGAIPCGSGFTREHRRRRCQTPRRILRG